MSLVGKKILVMGLGVHGGGLGVARWLVRQGAVVTITDQAPAEALAVPLASLRSLEAETGATIRYVLGEHRAEDFAGAEMVVANPAVRPGSAWLAHARAAAVPVETEMTLFFRRCPAPIIGITGTKGKSTTTLLTAAMLRQAFPQTVAAGNLRVSALEALAQITPETPVVLELSSFQLHGLGEAGLSPHFACITNFSPDHINYHGSLGEYARAKQQIYLHQGPHGTAVLHTSLVDPASETRSLFSNATSPGSLVTFDADPGSQADCFVTAQGQVMFHAEPLFAADDLLLPGRHNLANALAAAALARSFGVEAAHIRAAIASFTAVEHRQEPVAVIDDVRYVNDTTATNPAAALAALESIAGPLLLLAGGADKDLHFDELATAIARRVRVVVLLEGSATPRLREQIERAAATAPEGALEQVSGPYDNFAEAIAVARGLARAGETVLLSPGCASFGMFRNEFHRGEEFRRIVQEMGQR